MTIGRAYNKRTLTAYMASLVFLSSCSPKDITGIAEAKNIYVVGARILGDKKKKVMITSKQITSKHPSNFKTNNLKKA